MLSEENRQTETGREYSEGSPEEEFDALTQEETERYRQDEKDNSLDAVSNTQNTFRNEFNDLGGYNQFYFYGSKSDYSDLQPREGLPTAYSVSKNLLVETTLGMGSCIQLLTDCHIAIVNCAYPKLHLNVEKEIASASYFKNAEVQKMHIDEYDRSDLVALRHDIDKKTIKARKEKTSLLLFIDALNHLSFFTDKMFDDSRLASLRAALSRNNVYLVFLCSFQLKQLLHIGNRSSLGVLTTEIECWPVYKKHHSVAADICELIEEKVENGFLPSVRESDFYINLDKILRSPEPAEVLNSRTKEGLWKEDFDKVVLSNRVHRFVLYVAAFLNGLEVSLFQSMVDLLLRLSEQCYNQEVDSSKELSLTDTWHTNADFILKDCRVSTYSRDEKQVIDFLPNYEADACKALMLERHAIFVDQQFKALINHGLFSDRNANQEVIFKLVELVVALADYSSTYYGDTLLFELLYSLEEKSKAFGKIKSKQDKLSVAISWISKRLKKLEDKGYQKFVKENADDFIPSFFKDEVYAGGVNELQVVKDLIVARHALSQEVRIEDVIRELNLFLGWLRQQADILNRDRNVTYSDLYVYRKRFCYLLNEMLKTKKGNTLVEAFLEKTKKQLFLNHCIMEVVEEMAVTYSYAFLPWYNSLFSESGEDIKRLGRSSLFKLLTHLNSDFKYVLSEIMAMTNSDEGIEAPDWARADVNLLYTLWHYLVIICDPIAENDSRQLQMNPMNFLLKGDGAVDEERFAYLIKLVHCSPLKAKLKEAEQESDEDFDEFYWQQKHSRQCALIVESLFQAHSHVHELNSHSAVHHRQLLGIVRKSLESSQFKDLVFCWNNRPYEYNDYIIDSNSDKRIEELKQKREFISELVQYVI